MNLYGILRKYKDISIYVDDIEIMLVIETDKVENIKMNIIKGTDELHDTIIDKNNLSCIEVNDYIKKYIGDSTCNIVCSAGSLMTIFKDIESITLTDKTDFEITKGLYKHLKTGNVYEVIDSNIINATNSNDGQLMVLYKRSDIHPSKLYIREIEEFNDKFKKLGDE